MNITLHNLKPAGTIAAIPSKSHVTDLSLPAIGRFIGRDHTTALYARDKIAEEIQTNPGLDATIKDLMKNIRSR